jgi:hypothetical protein
MGQRTVGVTAFAAFLASAAFADANTKVTGEFAALFGDGGFVAGKFTCRGAPT